MSKKLTFAKKPAPTGKEDTSAALDAFVGVQSEQPKPLPAEKMKRFTIDVTESLHRRVKSQCAAKGVDMADELRRILEEKFPIQ